MIETAYTLALIIGGTALGFQFVLMLLGFGGDHEVSGMHGADVSHHHGLGPGTDHTLDHGTYHWFYEVLSLRTLSAALTFFGLAGKTLAAYGVAELPTFVLSSLTGVAAMYAVYWLFKQVYKLQHSGSENILNAVGQPATVYVPIPAAGGGAGKVTFQLQNRLVEYRAITDEARRLATGEKVIIIEVESANTVRVALVNAADGADDVKPAPPTRATA